MKSFLRNRKQPPTSNLKMEKDNKKKSDQNSTESVDHVNGLADRENNTQIVKFKVEEDVVKLENHVVSESELTKKGKNTQIAKFKVEEDVVLLGEDKAKVGDDDDDGEVVVSDTAECAPKYDNNDATRKVVSKIGDDDDGEVVVSDTAECAAKYDNNGVTPAPSESGLRKACPSGKIRVHRLTERPDLVWSYMKKDIEVTRPQALSHEAVRPDNCLRFVCISDTHSKVEDVKRNFLKEIPNGDVLLHAGDFTMLGLVDECEAFNTFLGKLPHPIKLVIPGNHESLLDPRLPGVDQRRLRKDLNLSLMPQHYGDKLESKAVRELMDNATILIDNFVEICGIKIYGISWIPQFGYPGFGCHRGQNLLDMYEKIPDDVDILLSHGPAMGFGDLTRNHRHVGCIELLSTVRQRVKPKYMVSGHIHEDHGISSDGTTTYINAAICTGRYKPAQKPIIFDYPLPEGFTREDFMSLNQKMIVPTPEQRWK